jgi:prevent-host-death family protein
MRSIAAGAFKANCLAIMDEVQASCESVLITKRGRPVAKLVPVRDEKDSIYNFMHGKGAICGDVVAPAVPFKDWERLK